MKKRRKTSSRKRGKTRLDLFLDTVKRGTSEITLDTEKLTQEERDLVLKVARERGLNAAKAGRFILIRDL